MENIIYEYKHDKNPDLIIAQNDSGYTKKHFHKRIEILYIISGRLRATVNDEEFIAEADDIVFVKNYSIHAFSPEHEYSKFVLIVPSNYTNSAGKVLKTHTLPPKLDDKEFNRKLLPIFKLLYNENDTTPALSKKGYFNVIMGYLFDHYPLLPATNNGGIEFIVDVLQYINSHYTEDLTLNSISSEFGYNKYYFSRQFNYYVGESLSNYINIVRVQHFMLLASDQKNPAIASIAMQCGFDSLTTFYRSFKKMYGTTPKAYFAQKG